MTLALYGHPFSSYTWKALIALYANGTTFDFRMLGPDHPEHQAVVAAASPAGKFPLLIDGEASIFEASAIIEYLHRHYPGPAPLLPEDAGAAIRTRMIDRVFDNYVMASVQDAVNEKLRAPDNPDPAVRHRAEDQLLRSYRWLDHWLADYDSRPDVSLIECAAAPALFYADWTLPIPSELARLRQYRAHLLALPAVARCVDDARPYRGYFPLGAPDRD